MLPIQRDRVPIRVGGSSTDQRRPIAAGGSGESRRTPIAAGGSGMRYSFRHEGKLYQLAEPEYEVLLRSIGVRMDDVLYRRALDRFNLAVYGYNQHVRIFNSQRVVGWILETWSGAELPDSELEQARASLGEARKLITAARAQDPPKGRAVLQAAEALRRTEHQTKHVERLLSKYAKDIIASGEDWVTGLQVVSTASFTIACVAGGAVLMAPVAVGGAGLGAASSGVIMGGSTTLIAAMSDTAGRGLAGEDLRWSKEVLGWGKKGIVGAVGGGAGGAIVSKLSGPLASRLAARLAPRFPNMPAEILHTHVKNALEGGLSNAVQGAIVDTAQAMEGNVTPSQFLQNLATNLVSGGIMGRLQANVMVTRAGFHQVGTKGAGW